MWVVLLLRDLEELLVQRAIAPGELLQHATQPPVLLHYPPELHFHSRCLYLHTVTIAEMQDPIKKRRKTERSSEKDGYERK